jgi:hypothetical protein
VDLLDLVEQINFSKQSEASNIDTNNAGKIDESWH